MASIINATTSSGVAVSGDTSGVLQLATNNGTTAVTIDTSQNVGIGTVSPTAKLHTQIGSGVSAGIKVLNGGGSGLQLYTDSNVANADAFIESPLTGVAMIFKNGGSERMRISSNGTVAINNTSTAYSLSVVGTSGTDVGLFKVAVNGDIISFQNASGVRQGYIQILAGSVSYTSTSDYRLKEDIAPMTGALNKVALLKPVTYKFKADGSSNQGFIAHELQEVIPEAVSGEKDAVDKEGNPLYQAIDQAKIVATLTAAIQEQQALITTLQTQVAALTAKVGV